MPGVGAFFFYMEFSLSTRWNTYRHESGEALVDEILELGLSQIELGYDLKQQHVPGVRARIASGEIACSSVHNYCPVPVGAPQGHPELFSLSSLDNRERESAVRYTGNTVTFAAEVGAKAVVIHAGNVHTRKRTRKLITLALDGKQNTPKYEKLRLKLLMERSKKVQPYLDQLSRSLEALLPTLEDAGIPIGIENLPSWEAIPTESELETILCKFDTPLLRYWHDMGHGQVRQNLGFIGHQRWAEKLAPYLIGMHIHDCKPPAGDHLMPPNGNINFSDFRKTANHAKIWVLEPCPGTPADLVIEGHKHVQTSWSNTCES
jgi:sugar phosphate isomerase/epimerase